MVTQSGKMPHFTARSEDTRLRSMDQVAAELRLLSQELTMHMDMLERITNSLHVLYLSVSEQE